MYTVGKKELSACESNLTGTVDEKVLLFFLFFFVLLRWRYKNRVSFRQSLCIHIVSKSVASVGFIARDSRLILCFIGKFLNTIHQGWWNVRFRSSGNLLICLQRCPFPFCWQIIVKNWWKATNYQDRNKLSRRRRIARRRKQGNMDGWLQRQAKGTRQRVSEDVKMDRNTQDCHTTLKRS